MIVRSNNQPTCSQEFDVMLCWLNNNSARPGAKYSIKHTSNDQKAIIKEVVYKMDINAIERNNEDKSINMNDICRVKIRTTKPIMIDEYRDNRMTGSIILVDDATNETVAAGMVI
jgi:sulfate adenylyltransferase subunit 1